MEERIQLIDNFKGPVQYQRSTNNKRMMSTQGLIALLRSVALLLAFTMLLLSFVHPGIVWSEKGMGLIQLIGLNSLIWVRGAFLHWRLLRHQFFLQKHLDRRVEEEENQELQEWMTAYDQTSESVYFKIYIGVYFVFAIFAFWQMVDMNSPVWPYLQLPFLLLYLWQLIYLGTQFLALHRQLSTVEARIS